jgi:hypothetical protein
VKTRRRTGRKVTEKVALQQEEEAEKQTEKTAKVATDRLRKNTVPQSVWHLRIVASITTNSVERNNANRKIGGVEKCERNTCIRVGGRESGIECTGC